MRLMTTVVLVLALSGCAAVQTAMNQDSDVMSGGVEARNAQAQQRQDQERARNESLQDELADLQAQQASLQTDMNSAKTRLRQIRLRMAHLAGATQAQRADYKRLVGEQQDLQHKLAAARAAPPPTDREDAADRKEDLGKLVQQKQDLERQVDGLQHAL